MTQYIVPMDFVITGDAFVTADSPEEAVLKTNRGLWDSYDVTAGETKDWDVRGYAEPNE